MLDNFIKYTKQLGLDEYSRGWGHTNDGLVIAIENAPENLWSKIPTYFEGIPVTINFVERNSDKINKRLPSGEVIRVNKG